MWKAILSFAFLAGFFALVLTFADEEKIEEYTYTSSLDRTDAGLSPPDTSLSAEEQQFVCRAALSQMRDQPLDTINATTDDIGLVRTDYVTEAGGEPWRMACRIDGNALIWAHVLGDGKLGHWQVGPAYDETTFSLDAEQVTITRTLGEAAPVVATISRGSD